MLGLEVHAVDVHAAPLTGVDVMGVSEAGPERFRADGWVT